jgi:four helix bundle protein
MSKWASGQMSEWDSYEEWLEQVPEAIRSEEMWQFFGYRKALFSCDLCWRDCEKLLQHPLGKAVARQLIRSSGSIAANIEEGYGRGFAGKERLYFLRVALGSARESKGWYYRARALLKPVVLEHRMALVGEVIALLVTESGRVRQMSK